MSYPVLKIAEMLLQIVKEKKSGISPVKLQKLLYFAQGFHLAYYYKVDEPLKPLFAEELQAWQYGPVCSIVYDKYEEYEFGFIDTLKKDVSIPKDIRECLEAVWEAYGKYTATLLIQITHDQSPWKDVYKEGEKNSISQESIKSFFRKKYIS